MRTSVVATALLAAACLAAHADVFEDKCSYDGSHGMRYDWRDLGNGFVAYYDSGASIGVVNQADQTLSIKDCAVGRTLVVPAYLCLSVDFDCEGRDIKLDVRKKAHVLLDEAVSPGTLVSFDDLAERFTRLSPNTTVEETDGAETCECHVVYPNLRGKKSLYRD